MFWRGHDFITEVRYHSQLHNYFNMNVLLNEVVCYICWWCHKDTIDKERVHIFLFYQNKNRGIFWRGHCNFYLTRITIFTKIDVTLTILHRFSSFNFCNVPHTSNCSSSKKFSHYLVTFLQEFFQNTHK